MPTYQYACTDPACDHRFEQFQSFTDDALTDCPVCSSRLRKVYGSVGVVFKGSGFYRNDSRAEANGAKKQSNDKDTASAASGASKNSESKGSESGTTAASAGEGDSSSTAKPADKSAAKATSSSSSSSSSSKP